MHIGLWPYRVLQAGSINLRLAGQSVSGGRSIAGTSQSITIDAGYWKCDLEGINIYNPETLRMWRKVEGLLSGRANTIDVPVIDITRPYGAVEDYVPHSDATPFTDTALYATGDPFATLEASIAAGGAVLSVLTATEIWFSGGETLSIEHPEPYGHRIYRVTGVLEHEAAGSVLKITPPFRSTAIAGARVEIHTPLCRMKLVDNEGMAASFAQGWFGQPNVAFVEDI